MTSLKRNLRSSERIRTLLRYNLSNNSRYKRTTRLRHRKKCKTKNIPEKDLTPSPRISFSRPLKRNKMRETKKSNFWKKLSSSLGASSENGPPTLTRSSLQITRREIFQEARAAPRSTNNQASRHFSLP